MYGLKWKSSGALFAPLDSEHPWGMMWCVLWMPIRAEEGKAVVLHWKETLMGNYCVLAVLGAAGVGGGVGGVSGHTPPLASSPRAVLLIKRITDQPLEGACTAPCLAAVAPRGLQVCIKSVRRDIAPSPLEQPPSTEAAIRSPVPAIRAGLGTRVNQNLSVIIAEPV